MAIVEEVDGHLGSVNSKLMNGDCTTAQINFAQGNRK